MPYPLKLKVGDKAFYKPGSGRGNGPGEIVTIAKVGRVYVTNTIGQRFYIVDGGIEYGHYYGQLYTNEEEYLHERHRDAAHYELMRLLDVNFKSRDTKPTIDQIKSAAIALGLPIEIF